MKSNIWRKYKYSEFVRAWNDVVLLVVFGSIFFGLYMIALYYLGEESGLFGIGYFIQGAQIFWMSCGIFIFATICIKLSFPDAYDVLYGKHRYLQSKERGIWAENWEKIKLSLWIYTLYIMVPSLLAWAMFK